MIIKYENGMTVADLKKLIATWPEVDEYGEPCQIWLGNPAMTSNQAVEFSPLNYRVREDGSEWWADILISHGAQSSD